MTRLHRQNVFHQGVKRPACFHIAFWLTLGGLSFSACAPSLHAQSKPNEYQVKAAYLYNFGRFIEWPAKDAAAHNSFTICVLGEDPFGPVLNTTLADQAINGHTVVAKRIPTAQDAVNCHILFISSSEGDRLKEILTSLAGASVLTVSDLPQFTRHGGMVQFVLEGSKVRFEVNSAIAERAGLTLSSELLKVAISVRKNASLGD